MNYQISKFLGDFLEKNQLTLTDLSNKLGFTHAYVSYVRSGAKTASKNFIATMIKSFPILKNQEKELYEKLDNDKKIEKLKNLEKKRRETIGGNEILNKFSKLTKRDHIQLEEVMSTAQHFFNDENVTEDDKKKLYDSLQELYFDAKSKKKKKK